MAILLGEGCKGGSVLLQIVFTYLKLSWDGKHLVFEVAAPVACSPYRHSTHSIPTSASASVEKDGGKATQTTKKNPCLVCFELQICLQMSLGGKNKRGGRDAS